MTSVIANKGTRWLAALVASALVLALMIGGDQPSAQAIGPGETDIAYVADGYNFPDALMGATLATLNNAPMLGVRSPSTGDVVPPETADELDRLTNDKANKLATIYVFGGPAAVSDKVVGDLEAWANNVQRIFGDNRFGTMEAISQMLPTKAKDADLLDGKDSTDFLGNTEKAADSGLLDGMDSTDFLGATEKAADSELLDGRDSTAYRTLTFETHKSYGMDSFTASAELLQLDVSVPVDGTLVLNYSASVEYNATDSGYLIQLALDDPTCGTADADSRAFGNVASTDEWDSASGTFAFEVAAGDHSVSLCGLNQAGSPFLLNAQISGVFEPGGSLSATATSMSSSNERSSSPF